jgi:hypothetical protein
MERSWIIERKDLKLRAFLRGRIYPSAVLNASPCISFVLK